MINNLIKPIVVYLLSTSVLTCCAFARIGETQKEIEERYGQPLTEVHPENVTGTTRLYTFNGYAIAVTFSDGASQIEAFIKVDKAKITIQEMTILLAANGPNKKWNNSEKQERLDLLEMDSADGDLYVVYALNGSKLMIAKAGFIHSLASASLLNGF